MVLSKETTLYERDENGNLLPQEVEVLIDESEDDQLAYAGEKIIITPMPRGEIKRVFASINLNKDSDTKDIDGEIILEHCINPSFTKDEIPHIKPALSKIIVNTIFRESGLNTLKTNKVQALKRKEDEFGKN